MEAWDASGLITDMFRSSVRGSDCLSMDLKMNRLWLSVKLQVFLIMGATAARPEQVREVLADLEESYGADFNAFYLFGCPTEEIAGRAAEAG